MLACLYRLHDHCWLSVYRDAPGRDRDASASALQVHLSAVNAAGSAYASFVLPHAFFERCELRDQPLFECLVHVKVCGRLTQTMIQALRTKAFVQRCKIAWEQSDEAHRLVVTLDCEHGT